MYTPEWAMFTLVRAVSPPKSTGTLTTFTRGHWVTYGYSHCFLFSPCINHKSVISISQFVRNKFLLFIQQNQEYLFNIRYSPLYFPHRFAKFKKQNLQHFCPSTTDQVSQKSHRFSRNNQESSKTENLVQKKAKIIVNSTSRVCLENWKTSSSRALLLREVIVCNLSNRFFNQNFLLNISVQLTIILHIHAIFIKNIKFKIFNFWIFFLIYV